MGESRRPPSPSPFHRAGIGLVPVLLAALAAGGCAKACESGRIVRVEGARLAHAKGVVEAPEAGEIVPMRPDEDQVDIPSADIIKLAIDHRVPWSRVRTVLESVERAGATPVILVKHRSDVRAFELEDEHEDKPGIELLGYPSGEGWKSCVRPRGGDQAKCVQQPGGHSIDAAFTRRMVREAVEAYKSRDVVVGVPQNLSWGDAVRLIDAARTCCLDEANARVEITQLDEQGEPLEDE